jgi:hypothetical protein
MPPGCRILFLTSGMLRRGAAVDNRYWNRIDAELRAAFPMKREPGRSRPVNPSRNGPNASKTDAGKTDAESILKHIEEALQEDGDRD